MVPRLETTDPFGYGPDQVRKRYGFEPAQMVDFKALRGDTSDNIPGVPGVGDKTAAKLVQDYVSVEALLDRLDELPEGRLKKSLQANADKVRLGKRMVTIVRDVPVELELEKARWTRYDYEKTRRVFDHLEFRQLLSRFPPPDQAPVQPSLTFEPAPQSPGLKIVDDPTEAAALLDGSEDVGVYTFTEGSGRGCRVCGLGVSIGAHTFYVSRPEAMDAVASTLSGRPISGHDAKETELALRSLGGGRRDWAFSTFLAAYLLGAGSRDPRLEDLAHEFLGRELVSTEQLLGSGRAARKPSAIAQGDAAEYSARRAEAILNLRPRLEAEMRNLGVDYLFHEIELPLAGVLADMETEGVAIDVPYLKQMQEELGSQLAAIETEVEEVAGQKFNLNAPQQLAKVLFEDLRLPVGKRTKTGYSTRSRPGRTSTPPPRRPCSRFRSSRSTPTSDAWPRSRTSARSTARASTGCRNSWASPATSRASSSASIGPPTRTSASISTRCGARRARRASSSAPRAAAARSPTCARPRLKRPAFHDSRDYPMCRPTKSLVSRDYRGFSAPMTPVSRDYPGFSAPMTRVSRDYPSCA